MAKTEFQPSASSSQPSSLNTELKSDHDASCFLFNYDHSTSNPYNWSIRYKWSLIILISAMSLAVNLAILMSAPATPQILQEFKCENPLYGTLLVSVWELGEVFGPLILAPLSEIYGRLPVYHVTTVLFVILSIIAGFSINVQMLIGFRFLLGVNVASVVLNPCIVGDMFRPEQRGKALSIMGMVPYVAPCLGPLLGGTITDSLSWRWTFWVIAIITGSLEVALLFTLRETYKVTILKKEMAKMKSQQLSCNQFRDDATNKPKMRRFAKSVTKPIAMMFTLPVLPLLSISGSFSMGLCYVVITSLTDIFKTTYNFSESAVGLSYMGLGIGMVSGIALGGFFLDKIYNGRGDKATPEDRLPVMAISYLFIPLGILIFGWTAQSHIHWIVSILSTFLVGFGFTAVTLSSWAYLIDAFGIYAASAIAGVTVVRNAASATFPLTGPPLRAKMGLGLAYTTLALIGFMFSPVPFILISYGKRLRGKNTSSLYSV